MGSRYFFFDQDPISDSVGYETINIESFFGLLIMLPHLERQLAKGWFVREYPALTRRMEMKYPKKRKRTARETKHEAKRTRILKALPMAPLNVARRSRLAHSRMRRRRSFFPDGPPERFYVTLRTSYVAAYAPAAQTGQIGFDLNNPDDPFTTLAAVQPTYYDQYAAIYDRVVVLSGRVRIKYAHGNDDTTVMGYYQDGVNTHIGTADDFLSLPHVTSRILTPDIDIAIINHKFDTGKILGHPVDMSADGFTVNAGGPTEHAYGHLCFSNETSNIVGQLIITIHQDCIFHRVKKYISQSS